MKRIIKSQVIFCFIMGVAYSCKTSSEEKYVVKSGAFKSGITETGELQAISSKMMPMPFIGWQYGWRYKIIALAEHGQKVSKGDTVVKIDPSPVIKILEEKRNSFESEKASLKKLSATHYNSLRQISSELESEKANRNLISLQLEKFRFESDKKKEMKRLDLEIANIKVANIQDKYKQTQIVFKNEIQIQEIKLQQIEKSIREAEIALEKLILTSPINGIAQLERNRRSKKMIQMGDDIHQGANIVSIPDMSQMKVISSINETDIAKIKLQQEVVIRLDAYPEKAFYGKISYIGKLSHEKDEKSPIKVFDFEVIVNESNEALKPGMTVSCEIILTEYNETLFVENECIFKNAENYYVIENSSMKKIPINLLATNNKYSAISGSVKKEQKLFSISDLDKINSHQN